MQNKVEQPKDLQNVASLRPLFTTVCKKKKEQKKIQQMVTLGRNTLSGQPFVTSQMLLRVSMHFVFWGEQSNGLAVFLVKHILLSLVKFW